MYRLRRLKCGNWQIHVKNGPAYEGCLSRIYWECQALGLPGNEVVEAVEELIKLDHDYAEFGVFKTFMYTLKDRKAA